MKKITKYEIIKGYGILKAEIQKRVLKFSPNVLLDKALFKRAMIGIDVGVFGDVIIIEDYISISGSFVKSCREAKVVDLVIKDDEENRNRELEEQISKAVQSETKKECRFTYNKAGPPSSYIPLFDKVIRPKRETSKVEISKPETTEEYHRIPVTDCKITATIDISEKDGIKALYCGKEKEIATYLFPVDKFTMKEGKAWIKNHKKKLQKLKEAIASKAESIKDFEYLLHHIESGGDGKEEIHHCYLYDHNANLFEQAHLLIKKGKVYLDGKEIKEGVFHIIKGLETKQEVAWSDEEAKKGGIKSKKIVAGMTIKEKGKEW